MNGIFVAIDFHALGNTVVMDGKGGEAARIQDHISISVAPS